jgi:hypothetical protein
MCLEPNRPVLPPHTMKKGVSQAVGRPFDRCVRFQKAGACDDDEFGGHEPRGIETGILPQTMADRQIDGLPLEIDQGTGRL